jgi:N-acetylglucosaminyl-diphospho-decaprenol L-rhamnosyltransferase
LATGKAVQASFIIVNWNTRDLTAQAVASILEHEAGRDIEILVVDNGSTDGSVAHLEERFPGIRVIARGGNAGFARANNEGAEAARGEWLVLFNSDAYLTEPVLPALLAAADAAGKDCLLTCGLRYGDGSPQPSGLPFPTLAGFFREIVSDTLAARRRVLASQALPGASLVPVDWITGAFLMAPRRLYLELGGLDPGIFMYAEDVDFCRKAERRGVPRYLVPAVSAVHLGGASVNHLSARSLRLTDDGRLAYFRRWHGRAAASALRAIFLARSLARLAYFGGAGLARRDRGLLAKAGVHLRGALHLALGARP